MLIPVLEELQAKSVISLGLPGKKKTGHVGQCTIHAWLSSQERHECMRNAKLVIFSGGHITCFETIKYAKPSICIPTQPEQLGNAMKLQNLNCSLVVKNQKQLKEAVRTIEGNMQLYRSSVEELNRFSNRFNGVDRATEIIEETAE
jgi:UDP:flavonoid glycosyltransferase YjiC (YdhE family)